MFFNMDMEKAFNKMEWKFILSIMQKLGFHSSGINWIRLCIFSSSFFILINGSPFGLFSPKRGFRQGDPLSPFLLILGFEVLSRLLFREESVGRAGHRSVQAGFSPFDHPTRAPRVWTNPTPDLDLSKPEGHGSGGRKGRNPPEPTCAQPYLWVAAGRE
jgi:hypothetical protein